MNYRLAFLRVDDDAEGDAEREPPPSMTSARGRQSPDSKTDTVATRPAKLLFAIDHVR
jgi:hypothetical protein